VNLCILPCVNNPILTKKCIDSVLAQDIPVAVFVILNGSHDCAPVIRSYGQRIRSIAYTEPISLNVVWNQALDLAFNTLKLEHVLVINNDVILRPDTYNLLLADGGGFVTGVGVGTMEQLAICEPASRSPHPTFSCFLIRAEVWHRVGKFDERYWAFASDCDYHLRMDRMNIDSYSINLPFYHEGSGTMKHMSNDDRDLLQKRADADREEFIRQHGFAIASPEYEQAFRHSKVSM
jgi:glycosyltransferase involved in cell wall biosynthesis